MSVPVVLLPGMMCDARVFAHQIDDLSRDHVVTVAPVTQASRVEDLAKSLLAKLPSRFVLIGHCMGGVVAMDMLRQAPERVDRICIMDASPLADTPEEAAAREPMIIKAKAGQLAEILPEFTKPDYLAAGPDRVEILRRLHQMGAELGSDIFLRQSRAMQRRRDQQATLRRCKCPALIVCGDEDMLTPVRRHTFMAELMTDARLERISGAGHFPSLEQPDLVTGILRDWLDQPMVLQ